MARFIDTKQGKNDVRDMEMLYNAHIVRLDYQNREDLATLYKEQRDRLSTALKADVVPVVHSLPGTVRRGSSSMTEYKAQYRLQVTQFDQMGDWKDFGAPYQPDTDHADMFNIIKKVSVERSLHTIHPHVHAIEVRIVARESTPWDTAYKPKCPNCGSEAITDNSFERKTLHHGTQLVETIRCQRCMENIFETVLKEE